MIKIKGQQIVGKVIVDPKIRRLGNVYKERLEEWDVDTFLREGE